jgi:hypothetical protein
MLRTIVVHLQEQLYKLHIVHTSICRYHTSGCCVAIVKNFVHLVDLYTYFRVMHGAYNVKLLDYSPSFKLRTSLQQTKATTTVVTC